MVRTATAGVARRLAKHTPQEALSILISIDWSGDIKVAEEVLRSIDAKYGVDPSLLSDADIDTLLRRTEMIRSLDAHNYQVLEFINSASTRHPAQTLAMLLRRVLATDAHRADKGGDRWLPLPHNGRGLNLPGVQGTPDHLDLARSVRDVTPGRWIVGPILASNSLSRRGSKARSSTTCLSRMAIGRRGRKDHRNSNSASWLRPLCGFSRARADRRDCLRRRSERPRMPRPDEGRALCACCERRVHQDTWTARSTSRSRPQGCD
jgi:hypothetical protein